MDTLIPSNQYRTGLFPPAVCVSLRLVSWSISFTALVHGPPYPGWPTPFLAAISRPGCTAREAAEAPRCDPQQISSFRPVQGPAAAFLSVQPTGLPKLRGRSVVSSRGPPAPGSSPETTCPPESDYVSGAPSRPPPDRGFGWVLFACALQTMGGHPWFPAGTGTSAHDHSFRRPGRSFRLAQPSQGGQWRDRH